MTDRELLELAAKAAGIELDWDIPENSTTPWRMTGEAEGRCSMNWTFNTDPQQPGSSSALPRSMPPPCMMSSPCKTRPWRKNSGSCLR